MKRGIIALLITLGLLVLGGCSKKVGPEDTVEKYLSATKKLDLETMASTILPSNTDDIDKTTTLMDEKDDDYTQYFVDYLKANAKKMTFKIGKSEVNDDKATVTVDCKYIDGAPILAATIQDVIANAFSMAFSDEEMTDEEISQMFEDSLEEHRKDTKESFKEATIKINCIKQDDKWYISETDDELLDVATSGFISASKELLEGIWDYSEGMEDTLEDDVIAEDPVDVLSDINNYVIDDLWNKGFSDISSYLANGTDSMGQELDIDFTKSQLDKAIAKKAEYDEYIVGLDDQYADIKEIWDKLSPEIDSLHEQVKNGATELNTDLFVQYREAFSDAVYELY